jgi:glycosyltransferase involved in cell wall biosynthesis
VVRVIARLNVGGPAIQAITLSGPAMAARGYETSLVRGMEGPREGNMDHLARELGVRPVRIGALRRRIGPHDVAAVWRMRTMISRVRPQILHTHAAKAGTIGRIAATLSRGRTRPRVIVHTFHGHVLTDYFGRRSTALFIALERWLAGRSSILVAVSDEVKADLVRVGVASSERIEVIPLGFDLGAFDIPEERGNELRAKVRSELGVGREERLVTLVARLVPIKRIDRFLRVAQRLSADPDVRFLIVGDGDLHEELRGSPDAVALGDRVIWAGIRRDMPAIYRASDVVVLTSDNEGTPVSLIEALASNTPVVSANVGGVPTVVVHDQTGLVVERNDEEGFADAVRTVLLSPGLASRLAAAGRQHAHSRFSIDRLVADIDSLYRRLLAEG